MTAWIPDIFYIIFLSPDDGTNMVNMNVCVCVRDREKRDRQRDGQKEMFYLTTDSTHFIYGYMASDMVKDHSDIEKGNPLPPHGLLTLSEELQGLFYMHHPTYRIAAHTSVCYTSHGALAGTRNSSMGPPHEGSIRRPIAPWANALTTELHLAPRERARERELLRLGYV